MANRMIEKIDDKQAAEELAASDISGSRHYSDNAAHMAAKARFATPRLGTRAEILRP